MNHYFLEFTSFFDVLKSLCMFFPQFDAEDRHFACLEMSYTEHCDSKFMYVTAPCFHHVAPPPSLQMSTAEPKWLHMRTWAMEAFSSGLSWPCHHL